MKIKICSENSLRPLFTLSYGMKYRKSDMFRIHRHPECELGFIIKGKGNYVFENEMLEAAEGSLFLVHPNEQHCVPTIFTDTLESFNFHLTSYYIWNVVGEYVKPQKLYAFISPNRQNLQYRALYGFEAEVCAIMRLCRSEAEAYENRAELRKLVLGLTISVANSLPDLSENSRAYSIANTHHQDIERAVGFITEHISERITLNDIAKCANLSRSQLCAVFKNTTGVSPYEYLLLERIELALTKLRSCDNTVLEIAEDCGFENLANFNRAFKRVAGMTPTAYRRSRFQAEP